MKTWTTTITFLVLMMAGGTAYSEGISNDDIRCDRSPHCLIDHQDDSSF